MATSPKFFRVATEGATTDGRKIERADIDQMVATYDPATFAARVNVEHVRGIAPDGAFGSYGDILSLKAEDVQLNVGGQMQTRRALYAQIKPLPSLVSLTGAGQKLFTSIEINPNFAGTGKAYLAGVAVTDNPASLGTEMLAFCAGKGGASPLAHRKQAEGNLFTAAEPVDLTFADASVLAQDNTGLMGLLRAMFNFSAQGNAGASPVAEQGPASQPPVGNGAATAAPAGGQHDTVFAALGQAVITLAEQHREQMEQLASRQQATDAAFAALQEKLANTTAHTFTQRPGATGADNVERADC